MAPKPTKKQLLDKLSELGIAAPSKATVAELAKLVEEAESAPEEAVVEPETEKMTVQTGGASALNVRLGPSKSAPVIKELPDGVEIEVFEVVNGWAKLEEGYCRAEYLA